MDGQWRVVVHKDNGEVETCEVPRSDLHQVGDCIRVVKDLRNLSTQLSQGNTYLRAYLLRENSVMRLSSDDEGSKCSKWPMVEMYCCLPPKEGQALCFGCTPRQKRHPTDVLSRELADYHQLFPSRPLPLRMSALHIFLSHVHQNRELADALVRAYATRDDHKRFLRRAMFAVHAALWFGEPLPVNVDEAYKKYSKMLKELKEEDQQQQQEDEEDGEEFDDGDSMFSQAPEDVNKWFQQEEKKEEEKEAAAVAAPSSTTIEMDDDGEEEEKEEKPVITAPSEGEKKKEKIPYVPTEHDYIASKLQDVWDAHQQHQQQFVASKLQEEEQEGEGARKIFSPHHLALVAGNRGQQHDVDDHVLFFHPRYGVVNGPQDMMREAVAILENDDDDEEITTTTTTAPIAVYTSTLARYMGYRPQCDALHLAAFLGQVPPGTVKPDSSVLAVTDYVFEPMPRHVTPQALASLAVYAFDTVGQFFLRGLLCGRQEVVINREFKGNMDITNPMELARRLFIVKDDQDFTDLKTPPSPERRGYLVQPIVTAVSPPSPHPRFLGAAQTAQ